MKNFKLILILLLTIIYSAAKTQETTEEKFFKETYLNDYEAAIKSSIKENKVQLANKILNEASVLQNIALKSYALTKAINLVDHFVDGYPIALTIYEKIFELSEDNIDQTTLSKACALIDDYIRSQPSTKKDEKFVLFEKQLKYLMLQSQIYITQYKYTDTIDTLKRAQYISKILGFNKTNEMINEAVKVYTPYQSKERNMNALLEKIDNNIEVNKNTDLATDTLFYDFANIKLAILLSLRLDETNIKFQFANLWRKFRANNQKASKSKIYFKESDLDKSDYILFKLLLSDPSNTDKIMPLYEKYRNNDKKIILEAMKIGENLIDQGENVVFTEYDALINIIEKLAKESSSVLAQSKFYDLAYTILKEQSYDKNQNDEVTQAKIKIKMKELENLQTALKPNLIDLQSIPISIKKPDFLKLEENNTVKKLLVIANIKTYNGKDITDFRKISSNYKVFLSIDETLSNENYGFDKNKWSAIDNGVLTVEKEAVSVFHCYIHSEKTQKAKIALNAFGRPFLFINSKQINTKKENSIEKAESLLVAGENKIRIIVYHSNQGPPVSEKISLIIKSPENTRLEDIKSSTQTYRQ